MSESLFETKRLVCRRWEPQDFEPLRVDLKHESLIIEGVVVGVVRQEAGRA